MSDGFGHDDMEFGKPSISLSQAIREGNSRIVNEYVANFEKNSGKPPKMTAVVGGEKYKSGAGAQSGISTVEVPCPPRENVVTVDPDKKAEFQKIIKSANRKIESSAGFIIIEHETVTESSILNNCLGNYLAASKALDKEIKR